MRITIYRTSNFLGFTTALVLAAFISGPLLLMHGIPAFNHDWTWPPTRVAAFSLFLDSIRPISENNFGSINYYLGSASGAFVFAIFVGIFGAVLGLKILVFALVSASAFGTYALIRNLQGAKITAVACTIAFASSPVVANELAAGHIAYLLGYSAVPYIALCAFQIARGTRLFFPALGFLSVLPLTLAQLQFELFVGVIVFSFVPMAKDNRARAMLAIMGVIAFLGSPYEIVLALTAHPAAALSFDRVNLHWEAANSSALWASFQSSGYGGGYDKVAAVMSFARMMGAFGIWATSLAGSLTSWSAVPFLAVAVIAASIVAGINGPLWPLLAYLFTHVPTMALFRELYHFSVLTMLGLVVACAFARFRASGLVLCAAAIAFAIPQLSGSFWRFTSPYDPSEINSISSIVASDPASGSILYWPLLQPVGASAAQSGADPDAFSVGSHPSLAEFVPMQPLSQIGEILCDPNADVRSLLRREGVRYVVVRQSWRTQYFSKMEPALKGLVAGRNPEGCASARITHPLRVLWRGATHILAEVPPSLDSRKGIPAFWRINVSSSFEPSAIGTDPRKTWVAATPWQWWDKRFEGPVNPGIFALGSVPFLLPSYSANENQIVLNSVADVRLEGQGREKRIPATHGFETVERPPWSSWIVPEGAALLVGLRGPQAPHDRGRGGVPVSPMSFWVQASHSDINSAILLAAAAQYVMWALSGCAAILIVRRWSNGK